MGVMSDGCGYSGLVEDPEWTEKKRYATVRALVLYGFGRSSSPVSHQQGWIYSCARHEELFDKHKSKLAVSLSERGEKPKKKNLHIN